MKTGIIYYASDLNGDLHLAMLYDKQSPKEFCKAAMSCGIFAPITPIGNVRVFTYRQVNRLLSNSRAVVTITCKAGKAVVKVWKESLFKKSFTISESLEGVPFAYAENMQRTIPGEGQFLYLVPSKIDSPFLSFCKETYKCNFVIRDEMLYIINSSNDDNIISGLPAPAKLGTAYSITIENGHCTFRELLGGFNDNLNLISSELLITMFFKIIGRAGSYCDIMRIPISEQLKSLNPCTRFGATFILENMGYRVTETVNGFGMLYPIGQEEQAVKLSPYNTLLLELDNKEMILSVVDWSAKEDKLE